MAIASVSASPRMYGTKIVPDASGLRPMASMALLKPIPIPIPGPIVPRPMARPAARSWNSTVFGSSFVAPPAGGAWLSAPTRCRVGLRLDGRVARVLLSLSGLPMLGHGERGVGHGQQREHEHLDACTQNHKAQ